MTKITRRIFSIFFASSMLLSCSLNLRFSEEKELNGEIFEGKLIEKSFVNKVGVENPDSKELYFEYQDHSFFIKIQEGTVRKKELLPYVDSTIRVRGEFKKGSWDSDDPKVQSRIGEYIVIYELLKDH